MNTFDAIVASRVKATDEGTKHRRDHVDAGQRAEKVESFADWNPGDAGALGFHLTNAVPDLPNH